MGRSGGAEECTIDNMPGRAGRAAAAVQMRS
jgi:hypothetical protein